jgi:hypothetical protein
MPVELIEVQRIPTSGARGVEPFLVDDCELLAIPQLAKDVAGRAPRMTGGDSDTELLLLRRPAGSGGDFEPWQALPAPGGEDAEHFTIDGRHYLAVASIRTGSDPYDFTTGSQIYRWQDGGFVPFQSVQTFAAKQWKHWSIAGRNFLGLAQGVLEPGHEQDNRPSVVFEWDGARFVPRQRIPSRWAYNWHRFQVGDADFVAHADHLDPSLLYRWDGTRLVPHQVLAERAGRAFASFEQDGEQYLVVACLQAPTRLKRWDGTSFVDVQELAGLGGREVAVVRYAGRLLVVRINFVTGDRSAPITALQSQIYEWTGDALEVVAEFPTAGGTDAVAVTGAGAPQLLVSNSLTAEQRFSTDTIVYALKIS